LTAGEVRTSVDQTHRPALLGLLFVSSATRRVIPREFAEPGSKRVAAETESPDEEER
jgi:hypothetical protein